MAYCFGCNKKFHYLGIASHRAMHRNRREKVTIEYDTGIVEHDFTRKGIK